MKEEKLHGENLEQELSNANSVIDSLHEQIKHLENIVTTEQERNKQNLVSYYFLIHISKRVLQNVFIINLFYFICSLLTNYYFFFYLTLFYIKIF